MEVGKGTVDVLRFGEGMAEGTAGGVFEDALRAVSIVGTLGKGAKIVKEVVMRSRMMKLIVDPGGGRCAYVSATQALRQTGQRAFASVEELAKEIGVPLEKMDGLSAAGLRGILTKMKARLGPVLQFQSWDDVVKNVPHDGSVVSFGVRFADGAGHRMYAFRDAFGRVKIMDRGGSLGKMPEVLDSILSVEKKYGRKLQSFYEGFQIKDLFLKFVGPKGLATLAMEVLATTTMDTETTEQMFDAYKKSGGKAGKPVMMMDPIEIKGAIRLDDIAITGNVPAAGGNYVVKPGDSLSKIAAEAYGNKMKFGVIYMANKQTIGGNRDLIKPARCCTFRR